MGDEGEARRKKPRGRRTHDSDMHAFQNPAVDEERTTICHIRGQTHIACESTSGDISSPHGLGRAFDWEKRKKSTLHRAPRDENATNDKNNLHIER